MTTKIEGFDLKVWDSFDLTTRYFIESGNWVAKGEVVSFTEKLGWYTARKYRGFHKTLAEAVQEICELF